MLGVSVWEAFLITLTL